MTNIRNKLTVFLVVSFIIRFISNEDKPKQLNFLNINVIKTLKDSNVIACRKNVITNIQIKPNFYYSLENMVTKVPSR